MRKWLLFMSIAACLLILVGASVIANAGPAVTSPEPFTLVGARDHLYYDNTGRRGYNPGDALVATLQLTDETETDVGRALVECTGHAGRWELCTYAWDIAGRGEIVAGGIYPPWDGLDTPPFDLAVIGGTGEFADVRGTVHVEVLDAAERFTFDLIP